MELALKAVLVKKKYSAKNNSVSALKGVSIDVFKGEVVALLGPNGAGKTTFAKCIAGMIKPDSGDIYVYDAQGNPISKQNGIGCLLDGGVHAYNDLTIEKNLRYFLGLKCADSSQNIEYATHLLERFALMNKFQSPLKSLSKGMKQKVAIIMALCMNPSIVILDEPTLGLDINGCDELIDLIRSLVIDGTSILLMTHQFDVAERTADRVAIISGGEIVGLSSLSEIQSEAKYGYTICLKSKPSELFTKKIVDADGKEIGEFKYKTPNLRADTLSDIICEIHGDDLLSIESQRPGLEGFYRSLINGGINVF